MKKTALRNVISVEVKKVLSEDYARAIPDFAFSQVASDAVEGMRRYLRKNIQQTTSSPSEQRKKMAAAARVLEDLEKDVKDLLERRLLDFLRSA